MQPASRETHCGLWHWLLILLLLLREQHATTHDPFYCPRRTSQLSLAQDCESVASHFFQVRSTYTPWLLAPNPGYPIPADHVEWLRGR